MKNLEYMQNVANMHFNVANVHLIKMYKMDIRCDDLRCLVRISYVDKNIEL